MDSNHSSRDLPSHSTSLLLRVQEMQPEAWARLVEVFSPIVYRWARTAGLNGADSADVVQDVFVAVARNIGSFERQKEEASFRSWLATITRNRVKDCFRIQTKQPRGYGGTEALDRMKNVADYQIPSDEDLSASINLKSLDERLPYRVLEMVKQDCDPKTWQAFWDTCVLGDSANDVAARLDMNLASVYQAKSRILRRVRTRLAELP